MDVLEKFNNFVDVCFRADGIFQLLRASFAQMAFSLICKFVAFHEDVVDREYAIIAKGANWRGAGFHKVAMG